MPWKPITVAEMEALKNRRTDKGDRKWLDWIMKRWVVRSERKPHKPIGLRKFWRKGTMSGWL